MGLNFSIPNNDFSYRDIIECIKDSTNIHASLKLIFNKSSFLNIEDYFDDTSLECSYRSGKDDFKLFFTCIDCNTTKLCPFCFIIGDHKTHNYKKELLNLSICSCTSTSKNKCFKHKTLRPIDYGRLFQDESLSKNKKNKKNKNKTTTTTTTTTNINNISQLNRSNDTEIFLPNYIDYKNILVYSDNNKNNLTELLKVKNEIHIFIRYILIFLIEKPLRPNQKNNNLLFSGYVEVLRFLNYCARRSKFIANVIAMELLSTNIDLDSLLEVNASEYEKISLKDITFEKDIRFSIRFKPIEKDVKDEIPNDLTADFGEIFVKGTKEEMEQPQKDPEMPNLVSNDEDAPNQSNSNSLPTKRKSYMYRFNIYFSKDLKEAHIDLFNTLIDRSKTFKIFFYRHFFDINNDHISHNSRYDIYMLDKFYNDEDLISVWVNKSNLIKDILFNNAKFNQGYRSFDPLRFLPDIIRTNKNAAIHLVCRDFQKFTTLCMQFESNPIKKEDSTGEERIGSICFTQNIIFTFLYLYKQQTPLDLLKYFNAYLSSLDEWKPQLKPSNEHIHFNYYTCLPLLLSAAVIENESNYMNLQLGSWEKAVKYTYLLTRYYAMSQISYFNICKHRTTSSLARYPIQGIEVSATINALQILSLIDFKKVLDCLFKNPVKLLLTDSVAYNAYNSTPTYLIYRFLFIILKSKNFYFNGDCHSSGIQNYEYKKILKYHIVNLLHRGIDVPLDLGRSNTLLRNCSEKDVYDIIEEVSISIESKGLETTKNLAIEFDYIDSTRVHRTMPSLKIQNSSLTNNHLFLPSHFTRKIKDSYRKCVDDYYDYTNVYHIFYYGFPGPEYPLESLRDNTFDSEMGPTKGTPFSVHSSRYLSHTLKEPLLYRLLFRELIHSIYSNAHHIEEYPIPIIIHEETTQSKKISISIDILKIISYIMDYSILNMTSAELTLTKKEFKRHSDSKEKTFLPSTTNSLTILLDTHLNNHKSNLSIMQVVFKIIALNDERIQFAQRINQTYKNLISNNNNTNTKKN
ncbi:hypothetical protein DICPUDRAFT_82116 [Dictyostelium purpureum]|uniref:UBR-type domain-containing protein n=1 Tax=Dictyostelium purpureum TaxID=5786 RepID=F0ZVK1_DICPU|nr:uncharacterized protein DICPUDRAFT_82116 [Dictyostelium purpureum]EGC32032.1 hypothetical protein DICPUDRAFT_82116 [Dictyostelium purpureum]|eukprot:XP_003291450.1 hypothetical protein DICPUDRAFT_82116 [Dictyostelium purpureum]